MIINVRTISQTKEKADIKKRLTWYESGEFDELITFVPTKTPVLNAYPNECFGPLWLVPSCPRKKRHPTA